MGFNKHELKKKIKEDRTNPVLELGKN